MSEIPTRLVDTLPPPLAAPLVPRRMIFDDGGDPPRPSDRGGRDLAWECDATGTWQLPVGGAVSEPGTPDVVVALHRSPDGLSRRFETRIVRGRATSELRRPQADVLAEWRAGAIRLDPASRHAVEADLIGGDELVHAVRVFPLRTPTLPPATHTNAVFVGERRALLVDPGSPDPSEQARIGEAIDRFVGRNGRLAGIFLTHHHGDHVGAAPALARRFRLPIWAHTETAARLSFPIDHILTPPEDGAFVPLEGGPEGWQIGFTPGHAAGHLVLWHPESRAMVAGDMIASIGTILVDPDEGDMSQYLASLERIAALEPLSVQPAHGDPVIPGHVRIRGTLQHRRWREATVLSALSSPEGDTLEAITAVAYKELPPGLRWLAARATLAHLRDLARRGVLTEENERWHPVAAP